MDELIYKKDALDALTKYIYYIYKAMEGKTLPMEDCRNAAESVLDELPTVQPNHNAEVSKMVDDLISRQAAIDAIHCDITVTGRQNAELVATTIGAFADRIKALPTVQPDEKLEKCRFEYINACRTVTYPTPDTTKKDISDAYAVIKALQPIFGDTPFAKVERGETDG